MFNKTLFIHSVRRQLISECSILSCKVKFIAIQKTVLVSKTFRARKTFNSGEQDLKMKPIHVHKCYLFRNDENSKKKNAPG